MKQARSTPLGGRRHLFDALDAGVAGEASRAWALFVGRPVAAKRAALSPRARDAGTDA